jgi:hypothetical protein
MDGIRFDRWTKCFASGMTRRKLVKMMIGGGAGTLLGESGLDGARAATCRGAGRTCSKPAQCCSGLCGAGANRRRVCLCPPGSVQCGDGCIPDGACCTAGDCPPPPVCHKATCDAGVCGTTLTPGRRCDDGDACTVHDSCQPDGSCQGTPKDCSALTGACNDGVCCPPGMHNSGGICCFNSGLTTNFGGRCVDIGHPFCVGGQCCSFIGQCF